MRSVLMCCLLILSFSALAEAQENTARRWRDGQEYYETGRYELALLEYDAILLSSESSLDRVTASMNRASVLGQLERWEEAIETLRGIAIDDSTPEAIRREYQDRLAFSLIKYAEEARRKVSLGEVEGSVDPLATIDVAIASTEEAYLLLQPRSQMDGAGIDRGKEARNSARALLSDLYQLREKVAEATATVGQRIAHLENRIEGTVRQLDALGIAESGDKAGRQQMDYLRQQSHRLENEWQWLRRWVYERLDDERVKAENAGLPEGVEEVPEGLLEARQIESLFSQGETLFRSGGDLLGEYRLWEARRSYSQAALWLRILRLYGDDGSVDDPIDYLLNKRVTDAEKAIDTDLPAAAASLWIDAGLAQQMAHQLIAALVTTAPADEERAFAQAQLRELQDRLSVEPAATEEDLLRAEYDSAFYRRVADEESAILLELHSRLLRQSAPDETLESVSWNKLLMQLRIVDTKLRLRSDVEDAVNARAAAARGVLSEALAYAEPPNYHQLTDVVERSLLAWNVRQYLVAKLEAAYVSHDRVGVARNMTSEILQISTETTLAAHEAVRKALPSEENGITTELIDDLEVHLSFAAQSDRIAADSLDRGVWDVGRVHLYAAREWIGAAKRLLVPDEKRPAAVLEDGIDKQSIALDLVLATDDIRRQVAVGEEDLSGLAGALLVLQGRVQTAVEGFVQAAQLAVEAQGGSWEEAAREEPWNEVLSLFREGYEAATQAFSELERSTYEASTVVLQQQQAIDRWQEALEKLSEKDDESKPDGQQPPPEGDGDGGDGDAGDSGDGDQGDTDGDSGSQDQDSSSQSEGQEGSQGDGTNERDGPSEGEQRALELLQQMEQEDAALRDATKQVPRKGLRPW